VSTVTRFPIRGRRKWPRELGKINNVIDYKVNLRLLQGPLDLHSGGVGKKGSNSWRKRVLEMGGAPRFFKLTKSGELEGGRGGGEGRRQSVGGGGVRDSGRGTTTKSAKK